MSFFSLNRNQTIVFGTLLFVVVLGALYFFIYVPANQRNMEEQRFRSLRNVETNIHSKIDNSVALLNNLLTTYIKDSSAYNREKVKTYIGRYPRENFVLLPVEQLKDTANAAADTTCIIRFVNDQLQIKLRKGSYQASLKYTSHQFFDPLLPQDVFDEYILLKAGKIVYQTFPSGITAISADSLKTDKSAFKGGQIKSAELSGTRYKLFSQQLNISQDSILTVSGLLKEENYGAEKNRLPENVVLLLLTVAIAMILALPWIKLYQMGNQDRLTVIDGVFSFAVSMLLMSLLFFAFLKYNVVLRPGGNGSEFIRNNLSDKIRSSLSSEIDRAYKVLSQLDSLRKTSKTQENMRSLWSSDIEANDTSATGAAGKLQHRINSISRNLKVNQVFWLKPNGEEAINWTASSDNAPPGNFANRAYVINLKRNKLYYADHFKERFYLDQVISWTSGKFTSVISKRSADAQYPYVAMSFDLKTFDNAILPAGYFYSIINPSGKVLYHSNPAKRLNENLFEEFSEGRKLKGLMEAGAEGFFTTKYSGKEYNSLACPVQNLPYYIVIMQDTSFKNIRDTETLRFSFTMLFLFFLVLVIQLLAVFFISERQSFFKKHYFDISWIGPNKTLGREYNVAILWNALSVLLLLIIYNICGFLLFLFMLLLSSTGTTLFLNYLFAKYYRPVNRAKYERKKRAVSALCIITIIINIAAILILGADCLFLLMFQIIHIAVAWCLLQFSDKILSRLRSLRQKLKIGAWDFSRSFSLMVFSRLIITSGLPVALFYISVYNYGLKAETGYRHAQYVREMTEKYSPSLEKPDLSHVYADGLWTKKIRIDTVQPEIPDTHDEKKAALFNLITSYQTFPGRDPEKVDSRSNISIALDRKSANDTTVTLYTIPRGKYLRLSSAALEYKIPAAGTNSKFHLGAIYWLLFLSSLIAFWQLLHHVIRKLFALNLPTEEGWQQIDEVLISDSSLNSLLFIIGSPGSGKLTKVRKLIEDKKISGKDNTPLVYGKNVYVADMILIPDNEEQAKTDEGWKAVKEAAVNKEYSLVIVNHFEYDIKNPATNRLKLNFLEDLLQKNLSKIFIISTVHPVNFLDSLNQQQATAPENNRQPEHDLERWHVLLGHFKIVIEKLDTSDIVIGTNCPLWKKTLLQETRNTHFLKKLQIPLINRLEEQNNDRKLIPDGDSLAFKMQITSHYFYMYIWQSLTKEEKFLLYDLAEDGLVNPYDDYNLTLLISKGLIINSDSGLELFNKGFRNFILTAIGASEAVKIRKQITDNGNWNKLKTPLVIFIVAVMAFLLASQQEAYSSIITYLTLLTAAVSTVLKFFTIFENSSKKSS